MAEILKASCTCGFGCEMLAGLSLETGNVYNLPAVCEECREFVAADYYNPRCPLCGKKPVFFGNMGCNYQDFVLYEEKHLPLKGTEHRFARHIDRATAFPVTADPYWCPRCGKKELRFDHTGFKW
jgi:RNA polymerase subunit RPABC4/transcription elongation factor Spt4